MPLGPELFTIGLVRGDIVVSVVSPFDDPREIEVAITQRDIDPATPSRVDALKTRIESTIVDLPGVRIQRVTGMTSWPEATGH